MPVVRIVNWRDVVGKDFLDEFDRITRNIMGAEANNLPPESAWRKVSIEARKEYRTKRDVMRFCGYEETRFGWRRHGWYTPYLWRNELRFTCTAEAKDRQYIQLGAFISWKNYNIIDRIEDILEEFEAEPDVAGGL